MAQFTPVETIYDRAIVNGSGNVYGVDTVVYEGREFRG